MAISATLSPEGAIVISGPGFSQGYSSSGVYVTLEDFDGFPVCRLMRTTDSGVTELIKISDAGTSNFGNSLFGEQDPELAFGAGLAVLAMGTTGGGDGSGDAGIASIDGKIPAPNNNRVPVFLDLAQGVPVPGEEIAPGASGGSTGPTEPPGQGFLGWLSTLVAWSRTIANRLPALVNNRLPVDVELAAVTTSTDQIRALVGATGDGPSTIGTVNQKLRALTQRTGPRTWSSSTGTNALAIVSIPAQGVGRIAVVDTIICGYRTLPNPVGGLTVSTISATIRAPITAAGLAVLTDLRMASPDNLPIGISLLSGGNTVVGELWVGWHVETIQTGGI